MNDRQTCGTDNGIRLHIATGEPLCGPCAHLALHAITTKPSPQTRTEPVQIRDLRAVIALLAHAMSSQP